MFSEIRQWDYPSGEIQRVQKVMPESWESLEFFQPSYRKAAYDRIANLYEQFIVPAMPEIFGKLILFCLPEGGYEKEEKLLEKAAEKDIREKYGLVRDPLTATAILFREGVKIVFGKPSFKDDLAEEVWNDLKEKDCLRLLLGKLPETAVLPVSQRFGFMSECEETAKMKANANFFIMDRFDCASPYDQLGSPIGLCVKDGNVVNPPLFHREALIVRNVKDENGEVKQQVSIEVPEVTKLSVEIGGITLTHGDNATFYSRPEEKKTPNSKGCEIVITGDHVSAIRKDGGTEIPCSGFVIHTEVDLTGKEEELLKERVIYHGMEDIVFGIQVGNSLMREGEKTMEFISPFYNIRKPWTISYPPSLYPLDFEKARAPRMAIGADKEGKPMLIWAEGAGKFGYEVGKESCGASLSEMAMLCQECGMWNGVNLDGGGSSEILLNNQRSLLVSDREPVNFAEVERAVPLGLCVR